MKAQNLNTLINMINDHGSKVHRVLSNIDSKLVSNLPSMSVDDKLDTVKAISDVRFNSIRSLTRVRGLYVK